MSDNKNAFSDDEEFRAVADREEIEQAQSVKTCGTW